MCACATVRSQVYFANRSHQTPLAAVNQNFLNFGFVKYLLTKQGFSAVLARDTYYCPHIT